MPLGRYSLSAESTQSESSTNDLDRTCGLTDDELTERFKESIRIDNEIRKIKGAPTAKYDAKTKQAYLEYPDGRREYVGE